MVNLLAFHGATLALLTRMLLLWVLVSTTYATAP